MQGIAIAIAMPTTYLIRHATQRAPWDCDVPTFPSLSDEQRHLEKRRFLHTENVVVTCACNLKKVSNLTYRGNRVATSKKPLPSTGGTGGVGSKFESTRFKLRRPLATTLLFPSGNRVIAGPKSSSKALLAHHCFDYLISKLTKT